MKKELTATVLLPNDGGYAVMAPLASKPSPKRWAKSD